MYELGRINMLWPCGRCFFNHYFFGWWFALLVFVYQKMACRFALAHKITNCLLFLILLITFLCSLVLLWGRFLRG